MTRDDIIGWMQEVGAKKSDLTPQTYDGFVDLFQRFAALVAAVEREACAKMFDGEVWAYDYREIAAAIRARGEQEQPR